MKQTALVSFFITVLLTVPTSTTALAYNPGGQAVPGTVWYPPARDQTGMRPAYRPGTWPPGAFRRPVNATYAVYPVYGYYYPPAAYGYGQPSYYPAQPPAPYGAGPWPVQAAPAYNSAPPPTMTAYPPANYSWNPQAYRPALIPRSVTAATPATPADQTRLADQEKRIVQLSDELVRVKRERNQALADLSMWTALGVTPDQVKAFRDQLAKLQAANQFLVRHNAELQVKLSWFVGVEKEVQMPGDLAGRVLRVDPKYGFVVLNIGEKQGVAKNGRLLIKRESKLVGKVRVSTVDPDTSIANIMPDWKLAEVMEGDQVIHQ